MAVALLPGLLNLIPVIEAYQEQEPPARIFLGLRHYAVDESQYLGLARETARSGAVIVDNPFVTEPQKGRFITLYPATVGLLSRWFDAPLIVVWHGLGVVANTCYFLAGWWLFGLLLPQARMRRDAFFMLCLGSGLVWVLNTLRFSVLPELKLDAEALRYMLNWTSFNAARIAMPLLSYGLAMVCFGMLLRQSAAERAAAPTGWRARGRQLLPALLIVLAFLVHPYTGLMSLVVLAGVLGWPWLGRLLLGTPLDDDARFRQRQIVPVALAALALIGLYGVWARQDPVYAATSAQLLAWRVAYNVWWYPATYGLPFLLAVLGVVRLSRDRSDPVSARRWTLAWASSLLLLASCPFIPGAKFQQHLYAPLVVLAAHGIEWLRQRGAERLRQTTRRMVWAAFCATLAVGSIADVMSTPPTWLYEDRYRDASQDQLDLLAALKQLPPGGVLSSQFTSALVPWKADHHVYLGHWFMSYNLEQRREAVEGFLSAQSSSALRWAFLQQHRIRYILEDRWFRLPQHSAEQLGLQLVFATSTGRLWVVPEGVAR